MHRLFFETKNLLWVLAILGRPSHRLDPFVPPKIGNIIVLKNNLRENFTIPSCPGLPCKFIFSLNPLWNVKLENDFELSYLQFLSIKIRWNEIEIQYRAKVEPGIEIPFLFWLNDTNVTLFYHFQAEIFNNCDKTCLRSRNTGRSGHSILAYSFKFRYSLLAKNHSYFLRQNI